MVSSWSGAISIEALREYRLFILSVPKTWRKHYSGDETLSSRRRSRRSRDSVLLGAGRSNALPVKHAKRRQKLPRNRFRHVEPGDTIDPAALGGIAGGAKQK